MSAGLHVGMIAMAVAGLPSLLDSDPPLDVAIVVEVVTLEEAGLDKPKLDPIEPAEDPPPARPEPPPPPAARPAPPPEPPPPAPPRAEEPQLAALRLDASNVKDVVVERQGEEFVAQEELLELTRGHALANGEITGR